MKVFGYPTFDSNGEMILTTYENEYSHMKMDIRVYKLKAGERKNSEQILKKSQYYY